MKSTTVTQIGQGVEPPCEFPRKTPCQKEKEPRAEIELLKTELKSKPRENSQRDSEGRGRWTGRGKRDSRPRSVKCKTSTANGASWCNHCFKCGGENHYVIGYRQGESAGQKPLNGNWLLTRDQK